MQAIPFTLLRWAAWAPGVSSLAEWKEWEKGNRTIISDDSAPELAFIKPMLRRRFSRLSRMALQVSYECLEGQHDVRTVFCSRHGEIHRTKALLDDIIQGEAVSPMGFSLSVHNTASGLYSIASGNRAPSNAIAAGVDTLEMGVIDALGHLQRQPEHPVLLVLADEPLPDLYQPYDSEQAQPHALALLLASTSNAGARYSLAANKKTPSDISPECPHSLQFLRFLLAGESSGHIVGERLSWVWTKHND